MPKSNAVRCREYRERQKIKRLRQSTTNATATTTSRQTLQGGVNGNTEKIYLVLLKTDNVDNGGVYGIPRKKIITEASTGDSADQASGTCVKIEPIQSDQVVIKTEVDLPVCDDESAQQYRLWQREKILQNNPYGVSTLSPGPESTDILNHGVNGNTEKEYSVTLKTENMDNDGTYGLLNKKIKTEYSVGDSADKASDTCIKIESIQSNQVVIKTEVDLPVYDDERAQQYRLWQREEILRNNPYGVSTLSSGPESMNTLNHGVNGNTEKEHLVMLKTENMDNDGMYGLLNKKIKTEYSMGDSADEASGTCIKKKPNQSNQIVVKTEVDLPLSDVECARQYRIRKRDKIKLQNNLYGIAMLSPNPVSDTEHARQYTIRLLKQKSQNNPYGILTFSPGPMSDAERSRQYRIRQRQRKLQNSQHSKLKFSPGPMSDAERSRQYRIRKRERKLQNNPHSILPFSPDPKSDAERSRQYRKRQRQRKSQNNPDGVSTLLLGHVPLQT